MSIKHDLQGANVACDPSTRAANQCPGRQARSDHASASASNGLEYPMARAMVQGGSDSRIVMTWAAVVSAASNPENRPARLPWLGCPGFPAPF